MKFTWNPFSALVWLVFENCLGILLPTFFICVFASYVSIDHFLKMIVSAILYSEHREFRNHIWSDSGFMLGLKMARLFYLK